MVSKFKFGLLTALLCFNLFSLYGDDYEDNKTASGAYPRKNLILDPGFHLLKAQGIDGSIIELEEGSQFKVIDADRETVKHWEQDAILKVMVNPQPRWISSGTYYLVNVKMGDYVRADYYQGPLTTHPFASTIYHVDLHHGEIYVRDGRGNESRWQVNEEDRPKIRHWGSQPDPNTRQKLLDTVLVGCNQKPGFFSGLFGGSSDENILISYENAKAVTHVRATRKDVK